MPLVLAPSFDEHTREQIELHVSEVQTRRMLAAVEYHAGKHASLSHESSKIQTRVGKQYDMLKKEIDALERAEQKVTDRLANIIHLKNELGLIDEMILLHPDQSEQET